MYDFTYMWNLKKRRKRKQTQIWRTDWVWGVNKMSEKGKGCKKV